MKRVQKMAGLDSKATLEVLDVLQQLHDLLAKRDRVLEVITASDNGPGTVAALSLCGYSFAVPPDSKNGRIVLDGLVAVLTEEIEAVAARRVIPAINQLAPLLAPESPMRALFSQPSTDDVSFASEPL